MSLWFPVHCVGKSSSTPPCCQDCTLIGAHVNPKRGETCQLYKWAMGTISKFQEAFVSIKPALLSFLIYWVPCVSSKREISLYLHDFTFKYEKIIPKDLSTVRIYTSWHYISIVAPNMAATDKALLLLRLLGLDHVY